MYNKDPRKTVVFSQIPEVTEDNHVVNVAENDFKNEQEL